MSAAQSIDKFTYRKEKFAWPGKIVAPPVPPLPPFIRSALVFDKVTDEPVSDDTAAPHWNPAAPAWSPYRIEGNWDDEYIVPDKPAKITPIPETLHGSVKIYYSGGVVNIFQVNGVPVPAPKAPGAYVVDFTFDLGSMDAKAVYFSLHTNDPAKWPPVESHAARAGEMLSLLNDHARMASLYCPECHVRCYGVRSFVIHLNDDHQMTREAIADHLDLLEEQGTVDLTIHFEKEEA